MNQTDLIQKLAADHQKKPFWKKRGVLLSLWFMFNFLYFSVMTFFFSDLALRSSILTLSLSIVTSVLGWLFFAKFLNSDDTEVRLPFYGIASLIVLMGATFFYDEFVAHNILHQRPLSLSRGDLSCFTHTVVASLLPLALGSLLIRFFFVGKRIWALTFLTLHVSLMAILWTEMTCYDREAWHLILGHESAIPGIFILLLIISYWTKKRASSVA